MTMVKHEVPTRVHGGILNLCGELPAAMSDQEALEARQLLGAYLGGIARVHGAEEWQEEAEDPRRFYVSFPEGSNAESQLRAVHVINAYLEQV